VSAEPRVLFRRVRLDPVRALATRVGIALAALAAVALVTYLGRNGYRDADGDPVSALDAIYYASVTVTTTGYGDITPVSDSARAVTTFVVTPLRVLFLIVLVGTTIELLTERYRVTRAESRWRKRVHDHYVIAGYGTKGRGAVDTLVARGVSLEQIVVIDVAGPALEEARERGLPTIQGDATRTSVLRHALIERAASVIVTCNRDDTATLVTLTAREMNANAVIVAAVRETENAHLLRQSGANTVIVSAEAAGRMLGYATDRPHAVTVMNDLIVAGLGLQLSERVVDASEVGKAVQPKADELPVAVIRGDEYLPFTTNALQNVQAGDVIVSIGAE
jgi:voltage-gated potassium channel